MNFNNDDLVKNGKLIAVQLLGEPNPRLSNEDDLRFGTYGSLSFKTSSGQWYDFENQQGGGVVDLIKTYGSANESIKDQIEKFTGQKEKTNNIKKPTETYDYRDENNNLKYQVIRYEPKTFRQRSADGSYSLKDITPLPYNLPSLLSRKDEPIYIVEGEKSCNALISCGYLATTNSGGAGNFQPELVPYFKDRAVILVEDNDEAGRNHVRKVGRLLTGVAKSILHISFQGKGDKYDVSDFLNENHHSKLRDNSKFWKDEKPFEEVQQVPSEDKDKYKILSLQDLKKLPRPTFLIDNYLPSQSLSVLYGESGAGKTFVCLDMALSICTNKEWCGQSVKEGSVLFIAGEGVYGLSKRVEAWEKEYGNARNFYLIGESIPLLDEESLDRLLYSIGSLEKQFSLVIIDTISRALSGSDENSASEMSGFVDACSHIQKLTSATVMGIHHTGKDQSRGLRGSSVLKGAVDCSILVRRNGDDQIHLSIDKMKDSEPPEDIFLDMVSTEIGTHLNPESSLILKESDSINKIKKKGKTNSNQSLFLKALQKAINTYGKLSETYNIPEGTSTTNLENWRQVALETTPFENDRVFGQAFKRGVTALIDKNFVGCHNQEYWIRRD